jgi:anti-sigma regulatory factor (Ser/Thr protein kinase)
MTNWIEVAVPAGPEGAGLARRGLTRLQRDLRREVLDNVRLLVSELVTNSIRHAGLPRGTPIRLRVEMLQDRVRVEVTDPGPGFEPRPVTPSIYQTGGWGLYLVDQLSDRWGVNRRAETQVWFEIVTRPERKELARAGAGGVGG